MLTINNCYTEKRIRKFSISFNAFLSMSNKQLLFFYKNIGIILKVDECFARRAIEFYVAHPLFCKVISNKPPCYLIKLEQIEDELFLHWELLPIILHASNERWEMGII